jgi:hypothetical protein
MSNHEKHAKTHEPATPEPGWILEVDGHHAGAPKQLAEVLEIVGEPGHQHFRVRWEDGRESTVYPSSDAHLRPPLRRGA